MPKRVGLYPGTFDPMTNGHMDIIKRAAKLVDRLVIGVAINEAKKPLFTLEERVEMLRYEAGPLTKAEGVDLSVEPFDTLLMYFAEKVGATIIIRGLRAVSDFEYEYQMALMNRRQNIHFETVFLMPDERYTYLSSSLVREISRLG